MKKKLFYINARSSIKRILLSLLMFGFVTASFAQNKLSNLIKGDNGVSNHYTTLSADQQTRYDASKLNDLLLPDRNSKLVLIRNEPDQLGEIHYRYYQTYLGYKVENSMFIVHTKDGIITGLTGTIVTAFDPQMSSRSTRAYDANGAILLAIKSVHAERYMWENREKEQALKKQFNKQDTTYYPRASLVWYSPGGEITPGSLRLVYKVDVYAEKPLSRSYIYVDAQTGAVLGTSSILDNSDATGTANTAYSGTRTIHSTFDSPTYYLEDLTRGLGIFTAHGEIGNIYGSIYTSATANWSLTGNDQAAMDAHWGVESTYDFYKANFNRNSVDNAGFALNSYVNENSSNAIDNAYWDGNSMHYGRRSSDNASITTIDITGHELTHGVTQYTSALVYQKESGAINESMSDIMGKSVQFWAKPSDIDWRIGNDMGWFIRDMSNPNAFGQPDTYNGTDYYPTSGCTPVLANDYCGVHTNSGVGNFMFYLLVTGGSGTNDIGKAYSVSGIGLAEAEKIIYRSETVYLTSTSVYADWRTACVKAANDLYGTCSNEAFQTANAWYAVGVGSLPTPLTLNVCGTVAAGNYVALSMITSCSGGSATIPNATTTTFTANQVDFLPGFDAVAGSNFHAFVTACTSGTSLLPNSRPASPDQMLPIASSSFADASTTARRSVMVLPNPATSNVNISLNHYSGLTTVLLSDLQGKKLTEKKVQTSMTTLSQTVLDVSHYANGVYFVTVIDDKGIISTQKLIIGR
jgi:Zn-dependent metalloprotease